MSWFMSTIYDRFMAPTEAACLGAWRAELLGKLSGRVLEIGAGTGVNLPHYPLEVTELVVSEPDAHMRAILRERHPELEVIETRAERLPFDDASFDAVVSTLVLCSVRSPSATLAEIHRVLRPGGKLVFLEHVCSHRQRRRRIQTVLEPLWKRAADNCHLTRHTLETIEASGFEAESVTRESMRKALPFLRETVRGSAVRRGAG